MNINLLEMDFLIFVVMINKLFYYSLTIEKEKSIIADQIHQEC